MARSLSHTEWRSAQGVLLDLLRHRAGEARDISGAQWRLVADEARRHRIAALTYRRLADDPAVAASIPEPVMASLRESYRGTALRNAMLLREASQLAGALSEAGIPVVLLKGLHLAHQVYPEPGLRSMADLDIMVRRAQLRAAAEVLGRLGYAPPPSPQLDAIAMRSHHLPRVVKSATKVVELHHAIELPTSPFRIDVEALWDEACPVTTWGSDVRVLSGEHLLLHLCIHLSYHHYFTRTGLKGLVDLAMILQASGTNFRWVDVVTTAKAWRAEPFVYCALQVLERVLRVGVPAEALSALAHTGEDDEAAVIAERYVLAPPLELPLHDAARGDDTMRRMRLMAAGLFPPRSLLLRTYGQDALDESLIRLWARRARDVVQRRTRAVIRIGPGGRARIVRHLYDRGWLSLWVDRRSRGVATSSHSPADGPVIP